MIQGTKKARGETGFRTNSIYNESKDTKFKPTPVFPIEDFTGEKLDSEQSETGKSLQDFEFYRVTKEKQIPPSAPLAHIGDSPILAPGNVTPITAESKAGKTAIKNVIIACSISKTGNADGFRDLNVLPNSNGKAVIDFDTEQHESDQQYNISKILERAGIKETPDFFRSYNIRTIPFEQYKDFTTEVCSLCNDKFGGIHLIIADGAADFITSVNDEAEANSIVSFFISLSVQYNCPVLLIIHLNENAGKNNDTMPRGHIGRQAVRKGYCQLNITKDGDISTLQVLRARKASSADTPLICYKYDKEKGYHVSVDANEIAEARQSEKDLVVFAKAERLAKKVFAPPAALTHKEAVSKLMKELKKSESTAKRSLNNMLGWEIINHSEDGLYRLKM